MNENELQDCSVANAALSTSFPRKTRAYRVISRWTFGGVRGQGWGPVLKQSSLASLAAELRAGPQPWPRTPPLTRIALEHLFRGKLADRAALN